MISGKVFIILCLVLIISIGGNGYLLYPYINPCKPCNEIVKPPEPNINEIATRIDSLSNEQKHALADSLTQIFLRK